MNKGVIVHLKNKFPNARVVPNGEGIDVFDNDSGEHLLAIRKGGDGMTHDVSKELGLAHEFDLAPIPKDARVHKLHKDGSIGLDDKAEERVAKRDAFMCPVKGHVKSCDDLEKEKVGWKFDDKGRVESEGKSSDKSAAVASDAPAADAAAAPAPKKKKKK